MNPFNAPDKVYEQMSKRPFIGPYFHAANKLGPERIQWGGPVQTSTCWILDGKTATEKDLMKAAKIHFNKRSVEKGNYFERD